MTDAAKVLDLLLTGYACWVYATECCRDGEDHLDCVEVNLRDAVRWFEEAAREAGVPLPGELRSLPDQYVACAAAAEDPVEECAEPLERLIQGWMLEVLEEVLSRGRVRGR